MGMWEALFGQSQATEEKDIKETLKTCEKEMKKTHRELERIVKKCEKDTEKLKKEIKKEVEKGNSAKAKFKAKQLVRSRNKAKFMENASRVEEMGHKMTDLISQLAMSKTMEKTGKALGKVNQMFTPQDIMKQAKLFMQENEKFDMKNEMMNDVMDDAFETENEDDLAGEEIENVFAEMGLEYNKNTDTIKSKPTQNTEDDEDEFDKKLKELKGNN